jgi:hypothetical protein
MEIVPIKIIHGEAKSWDIVHAMDPVDICERAGVGYSKEKSSYIVRSFGVDFEINIGKKEINCPVPDGCLFLDKLKDFFRLSILWFLKSAKNIPTTGKLVRPVDVKGGHRFSQGTHVLPTELIAKRFAKDPEGFIIQGLAFGAEVVNDGYGDAAVRLYPVSRVPVTLVLWVEDEEFPPRVDILFDSTCELQIDLSDIVWAMAMMAALVMLEVDNLPPKK